MLTKQDLDQISQVVRAEVRFEVTAAETRMMAQIKASEERITEGLGSQLGSQIEELAEGQRFIMEKVSTITTGHEKRITRLEQTVGVSLEAQ